MISVIHASRRRSTRPHATQPPGLRGKAKGAVSGLKPQMRIDLTVSSFYPCSCMQALMSALPHSPRQDRGSRNIP
jgi:hypothetical protein